VEAAARLTAHAALQTVAPAVHLMAHAAGQPVEAAVPIVVAVHAATHVAVTHAAIAATAAKIAAIAIQVKPGSHNVIKAQMNIGSCN